MLHAVMKEKGRFPMSQAAAWLIGNLPFSFITAWSIKHYASISATSFLGLFTSFETARAFISSVG